MYYWPGGLCLGHSLESYRSSTAFTPCMGTLASLSSLWTAGQRPLQPCVCTRPALLSPYAEGLLAQCCAGGRVGDPEEGWAAPCAAWEAGGHLIEAQQAEGTGASW